MSLNGGSAYIKSKPSSAQSISFLSERAFVSNNVSLSLTPSALYERSIIRACTRASSTAVTLAAPRLTASSPIIPLPAKRSSMRNPSTPCNMLKTASLVREAVGRVFMESGDSILRPRNKPPVIRIGILAEHEHFYTHRSDHELLCELEIGLRHTHAYRGFGKRIEEV